MVAELFIALAITFGVLLAVAIPVVLMENKWLFERNTPERKQLLLMLANLAEEQSEWERVDWHLWRHKASGVSFVWDGSCYTLSPGDIRFAYSSRGHRICERIRSGVAAIEKQHADLAALQGMNDAYRRWMN